MDTPASRPDNAGAFPSSPSRFVQAAAFLWGCVVFMPVGLNYLGLGLTIVALLCARSRWRARAMRLRADPLRWPLLAWVAWTLVVLALRPHHPETALSLWHDLRIAATLAIPVLLAVEEAVWALRGFLLAALFALIAIVLAHTTGLPDLPLWHNVTVMKGNKSINDALLFALLGASAAVVGLAHLNDTRDRWHWAVPAFAVTVAAGAIATFTLPSRTSLLGLLLALFAACVHQWRGRLRVLAVALCVGAVVAGTLVWNAPSMQDKLRLGVQELEAAEAGAVSEGSWVVRFYMYRETTRMMLDHPLAGGGLGSWTPEWHRRGPKLLYDYSMPHNDFLWMGAETGVPGLLILAAIMATGLVVAWRRRDLTGRLAFVALLILCVATSVNSALRDAAIGLSLPWIAFVYLRLAHASGNPWRGVFAQSAR
ncbi:Lipid A core - O-antigen ligase [Variovorax sp. SRS16]|uniref:O-antigen ligase family protein n=1 Tax=Variovorax sp. SRS16 TaxID=282217 RepID=UPI0013161053|nr:O-antigen ligase family protein [Variovorax sp. SRS16]VTU22337.1 Lipid A core - O-antigen ligase [Variovorax sp. SRS16]